MTDKPEIITFIAPVSDTCDIDSYQLCVLACDHESAIAVMEQYNKSLDEENARLSADYGQACDDAMSVARNLRSVQAERNELLGLLREVWVAHDNLMHGEQDCLTDLVEAYERIRSTLERHKC